MPKGPQGQKRPADVIGNAVNAIAVARPADGQAQAALEAAREAVQVNPRFSICHLFLSAALISVGRSGDARAHARMVMELDPKFSIQRFRVTVGYDPRCSAFLLRRGKPPGFLKKSATVGAAATRSLR